MVSTFRGGELTQRTRPSGIVCDQVKSLGKPPYGVKLTMEATCIMFGIKPEKINDPDNPGKKVEFCSSNRCSP